MSQNSKNQSLFLYDSQNADANDCDTEVSNKQQDVFFSQQTNKQTQLSLWLVQLKQFGVCRFLKFQCSCNTWLSQQTCQDIFATLSLNML